MEEETEIVEEVQEQSVEEQPPQQEEAVKKEVDRNWEQTHQLLKLQRQKIEELEAQMQQKSAPKQEEDEFAGLDPDDYMKVGLAKEKLKKIAAQEAEQHAKKVVSEYAQQLRIAQDEERMRSKHEDFDYVLNTYAIPLIKNDPALAYQIQMSKNPAETAYKLGKLSDNYEDNVSKQPSAKAEKILKNSNRPVSSSAAGSVLKGQADQFSKLDSRNSADRQKIYELSQQYARGA